MSALLDPLVDALAEKQARRPARWPPRSAPGPPASRPAGCSAFLSSRVLGQYEVFGTGGRLLLVAPNIVDAERKLGVDPSDFRLWVCLHEVTHQLQFTAVPWLRGHLEAQIAEFVEATDLAPTCCGSGCRTCCASVGDAVRGWRRRRQRGAAGAGPRPPRSARCSTGSPRS